MSMKHGMKIMLPVVMVLAGLSHGAVAQVHAPMPQAVPPPTSAEDKAPLEDRFDQCLKNPSCTTRVRLQIIQEENDQMNNHFQKIHQACADSDFQECMGREKADVDAWYQAQDHMQKMMASMEAGAMSGKEPAAGTPSSSPKTNK